MMKPRPMIMRRFIVRHGQCAVCRAYGLFSYYDTAIREPVCMVCLPELIRAEVALQWSGMEHPGRELVGRNP